MAKGTVSAAKATDQVEAALTKGTGGTPQPETLPWIKVSNMVSSATQEEALSPVPPGAVGTEPPPTPVHRVLDPSHAIAEIKSKVGTLTTVVHNVGHYSTLAFDEVEALAADIAKLSNFIRTKV